ncbi:MAG TPA: tRNA (cytidine(56)-2'-O)-methyltransferase, partial [Nitrosopumilaceae archaeon]|nr:tRNA (cytidine(56)-2'-O)-methyltransferase [Nitrosopumilaceae archaeon]
EKINKTWGGDFEISFINNWKEIVKRKKKSSKIIHLTMYGENVNDVELNLKNEQNLLIVVGAEKVPREVYDIADYNVAIGNQPHSEISALAVLLDRILKGKQFQTPFDNAQRKIIPTKQGKNVIVNKTRD